MDELAKEHQGLMIALEHRFYGESRPTKDLSTESLKFLTSQQAYQQSQSAFIQSKRDFLAAQLQLISAMGGDWTKPMNVQE